MYVCVCVCAVCIHLDIILSVQTVDEAGQTAEEPVSRGSLGRGREW